MHALISELYPVCRSITGDGVRQTLARLQREIPLEIREVPSGTEVFDWTVPKEWNIRDAYIADDRGRRIVDFRNSSLHVVNYSVPVRRRMSLGELRPHLHTLPERPDWIPYRTSYYKETWGFCLTQNQLNSLEDIEYDVVIDSTLENGHLTYGELLIPGTTDEEVLFSSHVCHPSLANDNLSGIAVAVSLAKSLAQNRSRYSYRFIFAPGTIGAVVWLALNRERAERIRHGLVMTCVGDKAGFTYKKTRRGDAMIDRAMAQVFHASGEPHRIVEFSPYGYDERQYCSPGFNLPVGCLMRSEWGQFAEYHTSADNPDFVTAESLAGTVKTCLDVIDILENNFTYVNQMPYCEPQLGKRGLYRATGGAGVEAHNMAKLWILNLSDGAHSLLDIAERAGIAFDVIRSSAAELAACGLLKERKAMGHHAGF
jgi:aminopeptidase-like protein